MTNEELMKIIKENHIVNGGQEGQYNLEEIIEISTKEITRAETETKEWKQKAINRGKKIMSLQDTNNNLQKTNSNLEEKLKNATDEIAKATDLKNKSVAKNKFKLTKGQIEFIRELSVEYGSPRPKILKKFNEKYVKRENPLTMSQLRKVMADNNIKRSQEGV